jgi:hypothetical protein
MMKASPPETTKTTTDTTTSQPVSVLSSSLITPTSTTKTTTTTTTTTRIVANGHGTIWYDLPTTSQTTFPSIHLSIKDDETNNNNNNKNCTETTTTNNNNNNNNIEEEDEEEDNPDVRICFRNHTPQTLLLCWVGDDGTYHHYYTFPPFFGTSSSSSSLSGRRPNPRNDHRRNRRNRPWLPTSTSTTPRRRHATTTTNHNQNHNQNHPPPQQYHHQYSDNRIQKQNDNPIINDLDNNKNNNNIPSMMSITDEDHVETSQVGHVFLIMAVISSSKEENEHYISLIQKKKSIDSFLSQIKFVGAYRVNQKPIPTDPLEDEEEEEVIHLVEVIDPVLNHNNEMNGNNNLLLPPNQDHSKTSNTHPRSHPSVSSSSIRQSIPKRWFCCGCLPSSTKHKDKDDDDDIDNDNNYDAVVPVELVEEARATTSSSQPTFLLTTTSSSSSSPTTTVTNDNDAPPQRYILTARLIRIQSDNEPTHQVYDTTKKYYQKQFLGQCRWPVMVEPKWYGTDRMLETILAYDLDCMAASLPSHALKLLRDTSPTPIYINRSLKYGRHKRRPIHGRGMCFHPGSEWLRQNGMSTEKSECVELYQASEYRTLRMDWGIGGILLHEFSHAYHHKGCINGYDNTDIIECYKQAMEEGIYDSVPVHGPQGPTAEAYAKTNAMEYFAELSTAFLGGIPPNHPSHHRTKDDITLLNNDTTNTKDNIPPSSRRNQLRTRRQQQPQQPSPPPPPVPQHPSTATAASTAATAAELLQTNHPDRNDYNKWYPHNRQQIREHDPRAYELLKKIWKVSDD